MPTNIYFEQKLASLEQKLRVAAAKYRNAYDWLMADDHQNAIIRAWYSGTADRTAIPPVGDDDAETENAFNRLSMYARELAKAARSIEKTKAQIELTKLEMSRTNQQN